MKKCQKKSNFLYSDLILDIGLVIRQVIEVYNENSDIKISKKASKNRYSFLNDFIKSY